MRIRIKGIVVLLIAVVFFTLGSGPRAWAQSGVLAQVGQEKITEKDVQDLMDSYVKANPAAAKYLTANPNSRKMVLDEIIREKVFSAAAREKGVKLGPEEEKQLSLMRQNLVIRKYVQGELKDKMPREEDLKAYYEKNKSEFVAPETRKMSHILVKTEAEAQKVLSDIKKGVSFGKIADQVNPDATKGKKGDLGWVQRGMMVKEFENAAFALKKGQVSGAVKTQFGYHLIKVDDIRPSEKITYQKAKDDIRRMLETEKVQALETQLRTRYNVKVFAAAPPDKKTMEVVPSAPSKFK